MNYLKKIYHALNCILFVLNGMKPWRVGYNFYKYKKIREALERGGFDAKKLPAGYGFRIDERIVEYPWLFSRLPAKPGNLLDAGSVLNFDYILSHEKLSNKKSFISTLAPERLCFWEKGVSYVYEDLREPCYKDGYFDWIVCLSTLEHVGMDNTIVYTKDLAKMENDRWAHLLAIKEFRRILKPGGILYISVPFGKYKNHGWQQVFNGEMVDRIINVFSPVFVVENYFKYEPDGWRAASREDCRDATIFDAQFQKTLDSDCAAGSRALICLEMVK